MQSMEPFAHILALQREGDQLAIGAELAGLAASVPSCPGWQVRDLLRHLGYVHRWAANYLIERRQDPAEELTEAEQLAAGPADDELIAWYRARHAAIVSALTTADPGIRCWTFLPAPSSLAFWARRQAHETAIHRADAQLAAGRQPSYDAQFAADGIDELLTGFFGRGERAGTDAGNPPGRLLVRAVDTGDDWLVTLTADGRNVIDVGRGSGDTANVRCTLAGPASGLYLTLWNRSDPDAAGVTVEGDRTVMRAWLQEMTITWA
jgi:uncharacterized protein (TIGR03083 family)